MKKSKRTLLFVSLLLVISILLLYIMGNVYLGFRRTQVEFDEDELKALAVSQVNDMINDNFASTVSVFDGKVSRQLDESGMEAAWDSIVPELGAHIGNDSVTGSVKGSTFVVVVIEQYKHGGLQVTISYNDRSEISGIYLNYANIEKELVRNEQFREEAVTIGDVYPLAGILTIPNASEKPPVVLLVHGSGASDKNETIYVNTPFEDLAHGLAEQGIATLRYDKRFYTYPDLATELGADMTLEDEVLEDVAFALALLANDSRVDPANIFVLGHSLGGGLTPYIASQNENVAGIISMAGTLKPLYEISYDQNKAIEQAALDGDYDFLTTQTMKQQMKQVEKDILILRDDLTDIPNDRILLGMSTGYQKSVKELAGENYIDELDLPILILQGDADFQVSADKDFKLWENTLASRTNVTLNLYDNLNHLMMESNGKTDVSEYQSKGTVSLEVIDDIADFVSSSHSLNQ